ncbi:MAG TPA: HNH endonuclease [Stellaceae bacterium]|nr:HNH endonuclease [Stellaceae bacterium]
MNVPNKKCIYCLTEDATRFKGVEHVIPQSFGTFGDRTPTLNCVCDDCNSYFGRKLDDLLARDTIEGIARYSRGRFSSEKRPQKRLLITLGEGPDTGNFVGARVAVDGTTGTLMEFLPQFVIFNFQTQQWESYFVGDLPKLKLAKEVYGEPGKDGAKGTWNCKILTPSQEGQDAIVEALRMIGVDYKADEPFHLPEPADGLQPGLPVVIQSQVDKLHKRALAKIFMNLVAYHLGCREALSERWDFLRNYVLKGEGEIKARLTDQPFWTGHETEPQRLIDDSIDVRVANLDHKGPKVVGSIRLYSAHTYELVLIEGDFLAGDSEFAYRFTSGKAPILGEKRRL